MGRVVGDEKGWTGIDEDLLALIGRDAGDEAGHTRWERVSAAEGSFNPLQPDFQTSDSNQTL